MLDCFLQLLLLPDFQYQLLPSHGPEETHLGQTHWRSACRQRQQLVSQQQMSQHRGLAFASQARQEVLEPGMPQW